MDPKETAAGSPHNTPAGEADSKPLHRRASREGDPQRVFGIPRESPPPSLQSKVKDWLSDPLHARLVWCLGGAMVLAVVACWVTAHVAYHQGTLAAQKQTLELQKKREAASTPEVLARVDLALEALRDHRTTEAGEILSDLALQAPELPSLDYLRALAALQAGESMQATDLAMRSVSKGERVADALVLAALAEYQKRQTDAGFVDGDRVALELIAKAMRADPAAAGPRIEAASFFRGLERNEDAYAEYEAARLRLFPVELMLTIDITQALLNVEIHGIEGEHILGLQEGNWPSVFQSALLALRRDDFETASALIKSAREGLPWNVYAYVLNDPALRTYAFHPQMRDIFAEAE